MIRNRSHSCGGFTLFELLVAMTVLSVVSTLGMTGFFSITSYWNELLLTTRLNTAATDSFAAMSRDFERILSGRISGSGIRGQQADIEDTIRFWRLHFEDDRITLPVEVYNPTTGRRERVSVHYKIERAAQGTQLVRSVAPAGTVAHNGMKTIIAENITGMRIQYYDGKDWRGQWDGLDMPELVRVSLSVMDSARADRHLSRMAAFRIQVK